MLGPEVVESLLPLNFELTTGSFPAVSVLPQWTGIIKASGVSGLASTATILQAPNVPAAGGGVDSNAYIANGVTDRPMGAFAQVLWISAKWMTPDSQFAQSQQKETSACLTGVTTGTGVSNTYAQETFSSKNCDKYSSVTNVIIGNFGDIVLPEYTLKWSIGCGAANCMSMGQVVDVYGSISTKTGEVEMVTRPGSLGIWGLSGYSGDPRFSAAGVIPGGMYQTFTYTHKVQHAPGDNFMVRSADYMGTFVMLNPMPNAQMSVELYTTIPSLYQTGIIGPAFVTRLDGVGTSQQLSFRQASTWEVVASGSTAPVTESTPVKRAMVSADFYNLMRDVTQSRLCPNFSLVMSDQTWKSVVAKMMGMDLTGLLQLLADNKVMENQGMLLKLSTMVKPSVAAILGQPGAGAEEGRISAPAIGSSGRYANMGGMGCDGMNADGMNCDGMNATGRYSSVVGRNGAAGRYGKRAIVEYPSSSEEDDDDDDDYHAGGLLSTIAHGVGDAADFLGLDGDMDHESGGLLSTIAHGVGDAASFLGLAGLNYDGTQPYLTADSPNSYRPVASGPKATIPGKPFIHASHFVARIKRDGKRAVQVSLPLSNNFKALFNVGEYKADQTLSLGGRIAPLVKAADASGIEFAIGLYHVGLIYQNEFGDAKLKGGVLESLGGEQAFNNVWKQLRGASNAPGGAKASINVPSSQLGSMFEKLYRKNANTGSNILTSKHASVVFKFTDRDETTGPIAEMATAGDMLTVKSRVMDYYVVFVVPNSKLKLQGNYPDAAILTGSEWTRCKYYMQEAIDRSGDQGVHAQSMDWINEHLRAIMDSRRHNKMSFDRQYKLMVWAAAASVASRGPLQVLNSMTVDEYFNDRETAQKKLLPRTAYTFSGEKLLKLPQNSAERKAAFKYYSADPLSVTRVSGTGAIPQKPAGAKKHRYEQR